MNEDLDRPMPNAELYMKAIGFIPWVETLKRVASEVDTKKPLVFQESSRKVLDLMCGPGPMIKQMNKGASILGVDINEEFLNYARKSNPIREDRLALTQADVRTLSKSLHSRTYDVVTCTAGLHHLNYEDQGRLIGNMAEMVKPDGVVAIADTFIGDYQTEQERQLRCVEKGAFYLEHAVRRGAPADVLKVWSDVIVNDMLDSEHKTSVNRFMPLIERHFGSIERHETFTYGNSTPQAGYHIFILQEPRE